jgi:hypothetical protein
MIQKLIDKLMGREPCGCHSQTETSATPGLGAGLERRGDVPIWEVPDLGDMFDAVQLSSLRSTVIEPGLAAFARMRTGNRDATGNREGPPR